MKKNLNKENQIHNFLLHQLLWFPFITVQHNGSGSDKEKSYSSYGSGSATSTGKDTNFDTSLLSSSTWSPFSVSFQSVVSEAPLSSPSAEI